MSVRAIVRFVILGMAALCALAVPAAWQGRSSSELAAGQRRLAAGARPNIVLIMADDLDWKLGTLDYTASIRSMLRQRGVTFDNALVPVSLCCPSRVSFLRGQYVHNHQVYSNGPPDGGFQKATQLHLENATIATVLKSAGYRTALMGKYLNGYPEEHQERYIPPGWDEFYSPSSDQAYLGYNYTMNENGTLVPYGNADADYMTDVLSNKAVSFINRTAPSRMPFFMYVSTYAPHAPSEPARRHANMFQNVRAPRNGSFNEEDNSDKPPLISRAPKLTDPQIAQIDERYRKRLQSMQAVDEMVARIISTLDSAGVLDSTYIIFTSDNGYHMGQHRFLPGKYTNYEEDLRVPLIVRGPGVPANRTVSALVSTMDLAPTFAAIAQTTMPAFVDGRSLVPLLTQPNAPWRKVFFLEQYPFSSQHETQEGARNGLLEPAEPDQTYLTLEAGQPCNATTDPKPIYTGLHGVRYKYVEHHACDREFYDLERDPNEMVNSYAQTTAQTRAQLDAWLRRMARCAGEECRMLENNPPQIENLVRR